MKFGVADYGMNVWDGGLFDLEKRLQDLKGIGYEGIERLSAASASDAMHKAALHARLGTGFGTCAGPDIQSSIQWSAALSCEYVWVSVNAKDLETFCRQANIQAQACARWGLKASLHNHLGTLVETQDQLVEFLEKCPDCGLVFDVAHHAAAGGDCMEIIGKYVDRITVVHMKDWLVVDESIGLDKWFQRGRFCGLGKGNIGMDIPAIMKAIADKGFDGWVFVEHDTHLQDPLIDLKESRDLLKQSGF